jgi:gamma-glutamylcyclotransferase (GGCT)/AIG2-like uncharacterized protein YtfP
MQAVKDILRRLTDKADCDISRTNYVSGGRVMDSFIPSTGMFCDNFILWRIFDRNDDLNFNMRGFVHDNFGFSNFNVKEISRGELQDNDFGAAGSSYISYKVSTSNQDVHDIINCLSILPIDNVFLHDIDVTVDCHGVVTRADVEEYLLKRRIPQNQIVNDLKKVGNNCISWYSNTNTGILIRTKVYNKFVQMLECPSVIKNIGSMIHELIANPSDSFQQTLVNTSTTGITRIEIKVYSQQPYTYESYEALLVGTIEFLRGCRIYEQSFENQWMLLVDQIYDKPVTMIYSEDEGIFTYCHWYNSLTNRIYGIVRRNTTAEEIPEFVSNYSYNGRTVELTTVSHGVENTKRYQRITPGITLIPGKNNSLRPDTKPKVSFEQVGLIDYRGMRLGLPSRIKKGNIMAEVVNIDSTMIENLGYIRDTSMYRAIYTQLSEGTDYVVLAYGTGTYRNTGYMFTKLYNTETEQVYYVRCNDVLKDIILSNPSSTRYSVRTGRKKRVRGYDTIDIYKI